MMNKDGVRGSWMLGSERLQALLQLALGSAISGCTLTSGSFEPALVSDDEAEAIAALDEPSAPLNEDEGATGQSCTSDDGQSFRFNGDDPSCAGAVELLPAAGRVEADAGSVVEASAPSSLPP